MSPASFSIWIARFTSAKSIDMRKTHTFLAEVVNVFLRDDQGALLLPVVLVELAHLAAQHHYLHAGYWQEFVNNIF